MSKRPAPVVPASPDVPQPPVELPQRDPSDPLPLAAGPWSASAVPDVPGVWHLCRGGDVVGGITLLPEAGWRVDMLVEDVVHGLNAPRTIEERGFGRPPDMLAKRRAARDGHPSAT